MIEVSSKETLYMYNLYHITKAFFPNLEIKQSVVNGQEPLIKLVLEGGSCFSVTPDEVPDYTEKQQIKRYVTERLYKYLCEVTGRELSWGLLTGIRPTKIVMQKLEQGMTAEQAIRFLSDEYKASPGKAKLACEIAVREKALLERLDYVAGYSLYIGIPFCPSICSYCSFGSSPAGKWEGRMDLYVDALCKELEAIGCMAKGRKLNTIYMGGGTPTTLSGGQLDRILKLVESTFSFEHLQEFTVEAGRPDSITEEKLRVLSSYPVTRISVNPQTMQQKTLDAVGRRHSVQDVKDIFHLARKAGFENINMDLIAGLPGENAVDMMDSLNQIEDLGPDSLTIHALAIKRAAKYGQEGRKVNLHTELEQMIEDGAEAAQRMGLVPYYLYRQKNIAGNFENVGYAKVDKAGIYNILIMEEKQTILAAGAGASTKIVLPEPIKMDNKKSTSLVRIENVKDITEYISRIDEMIERKGEWLWR